MSSDRRSRPTDRSRRRVSDEAAREQPRPERRERRRRTAYVPRQGSPRPARSQPPDDLPQENESRRAPAPPRFRTQQPPYRAPGGETTEGYDYDDADSVEPDDRLIEGDRPYAPASPRRQRRSGAAPRERRGAPMYEDDVYGDADPYADVDYSEGFDDSFIDEEDWYEEEAAAGAYRPRGRSAGGRTAPQLPRPSISISRPNVPRPTVPASVRNAALIQDRNALILFGVLLLSVLAMAVLVMNRVENLAPGFATHITASGLREEFRSEEALWQLPLMAGALLLMNGVAAWFFATYSSFSARFLLATSVLVHLLIWVALIRIAF